MKLFHHKDDDIPALDKERHKIENQEEVALEALEKQVKSVLLLLKDVLGKGSIDKMLVEKELHHLAELYRKLDSLEEFGGAPELVRKLEEVRGRLKEFTDPQELHDALSSALELGMSIDEAMTREISFLDQAKRV